MGLLNFIKPLGEKRKLERRYYPRIASSLQTDYNIGGDLLDSKGAIQNVSVGGICLNLYQKIKVGATLKLGVYLPDITEPAWALGKLVWTRETPRREYPYEAGIEFDLFSPSFRISIQNYIQRIQDNRAA
jgi:hypothetical protein